MKAFLGITLCVLTVWMTAWSPHPVIDGHPVTVMAERVPECEAVIARDLTRIGADLTEIGVTGTAFPADLAAAEGGWWNWVRKILRAILDLIPGGDEECGEEPQH